MNKQCRNNIFNTTSKTSKNSIKNQKERRSLTIAIVLSFSYAIVEAFAGWYSGSLALISDAGHMITDAAALLLAWIAVVFMQKPASKKHSYGFARLEVITALINAVSMLVIIVVIIYEAIDRIWSHPVVQGEVVFIVAFIGLLINVVIAFSLSSDSHDGHGSLNTRAALVHVISDLFGSLAAILAGLVIYFTGWMPIDPILSVVICLIVIKSVYQLLKESFLVLMEGVPEHIDLHDVREFITSIPSVSSVSDLHVWNLSSGYIALTAHVKINNAVDGDWNSVLNQLQNGLSEKFGVEHITIQPEF